jgi:hypothetical protein
LQASPSSQVFPTQRSHLGSVEHPSSVQSRVLLQLPLVESQESTVQESPSSQFIGVPAIHVPFMHISLPLQASPSGQGAVLSAFTHPVVGSHESSVQTLPSSQSNGGPTVTQFPAPSHSSAPSQAFRLSQPPPAASNMQLAEQQSPSAVLPSSQSSPVSTMPLPQTAAAQSGSEPSSRPSPSLSRPVAPKTLSVPLPSQGSVGLSG